MTSRLAATVAIAVFAATAVAAQLPAMSWTCPMHPDVVEDAKGTCRVCGMELEAVRLISIWRCPVHAVVEQKEQGKCRICGRTLVPAPVALTWTCEGNKATNQIEPGKCADGSAMIPRHSLRAHGDHNPKHGGIFFMAPDNWHHLEGTYPAAGRFRIYVYDDYSRPLPLSDARKIRGRVVTKEVFDERTRATRELASVPLVLARNGAFLEARIDRTSLPKQLAAKISFRSDDRESRFDFSFDQFSKDIPATPPAAPPVIAATPSEPSALLAALTARRAEVGSLVRSGNYAAIYVPALQAKDIALKIQSSRSPDEKLDQHVRNIVVAAYQLDTYGDAGDRSKIEDAYTRFASAVSAFEALVGGR